MKNSIKDRLLDTLDECLEGVLLRHRWFFVMLFLLPISVLYEALIATRNWLSLHFRKSAPELHARRVERIQADVKEAGRKALPICTGRPAWQAMSFRRGLYKSTMHNVRLDLHDILEINVEQKYVRVEPMVTMGQLTKALVPLGLSIPVLPEIDDLTVGGLIMGSGIETSSHRYGLFQHCLRSVELVLLSDGSLRRCSRQENSELFYAAAWSHGTIGLLVSADIELVQLPGQLVRLRYEPFESLGQAVRALGEAATSSRWDFVEAIMFSMERGVLITGQMVSKCQLQQEKERKPVAMNSIGRWYKPWFFKHVESMLGRGSEYSECVPLRDYYHRHTRSIFWELQEIIPFGNHWLFRLIFGWAMPPKISLVKLTQTKSIKKLYETKHVLQDLLVPMEKLEETICLLDESVKVYPLWLCPFKLTSEPGFVHTRDPKSEATMYADVGVYGVPRAPNYEAARTTGNIERFLIENSAYQMLYADTYTTRQEFRRMFDHSLYDRVRKDLNFHENLPEVYDKVNKNART